MAVPAHDSRDHEFALKYDIPVIRVVIPTGENYEDGIPYTDDGIMVNSSSLLTGLNINGLSSKAGASKVIDWLNSTGHGKKMVIFLFPFSIHSFVIYEFFPLYENVELLIK